MAGAIDEVLVGAKAICEFAGVSEYTLRRLMAEYDGVPVMKDGNLWADKETLRLWMRQYAQGNAVRKQGDDNVEQGRVAAFGAAIGPLGIPTP